MGLRGDFIQGPTCFGETEIGDWGRLWGSKLQRVWGPLTRDLGPTRGWHPGDSSEGRAWEPAPGGSRKDQAGIRSAEQHVWDMIVAHGRSGAPASHPSPFCVHSCVYRCVCWHTCVSEGMFTGGCICKGMFACLGLLACILRHVCTCLYTSLHTFAHACMCICVNVLFRYVCV